MKPCFFRRLALLTLTLALGFRLTAGLPAQDRFDVVEKTIPELQEAMRAGTVTAAQLVDAYLARIDAYDRKGPRIPSSRSIRRRVRRRRRSIASAPRADLAARSTGFRSSSRTTSTWPACRRRPARWRSPGSFPRTTRSR
jgi:hypothetical protein